jgi:hypothetical protein
MVPHLASVGAAAGHRLSAGTPPETRLRAVRDLARQHPELTAGLDVKQERDLLYCLVTVAAARSGIDAVNVQRAIMSELGE